MTLHRLIGGKQLTAVVLIAVTTLAVAACVPPKPPTTPTTTTTAAPGSTTTTTAGPTTTTTSAPTTTTTTTVPANPALTLGGSSVALAVAPSADYKVVDVAYTSPASVGKRTFLYVCFESVASPTFNYLTSCSNDSEISKNPTASATSTFSNYAIFHGQEPTGDVMWGLWAPSETAPGGYTKYTSGYLRFTTDTPGNTTDQQFVPFSFVAA